VAADSASLVRARWSRVAILVAAIAIAAITAFTAAPLFVSPQLEPDDYRFLDLVDQFRADRVGFMRAAIVENGWDHLWWVDIAGAVRFFRPTMFASYWFDSWLHGGSALGLVCTNVVLMLACSVLAAALFFRLLAPRTGAGVSPLREALPPVLAAALFAGFACHAECMWYIAGRNETLAALPFLGALALHAYARRTWVRLLAPLCFALAMGSKEVAVALPLVAAGLDRALAPAGSTLRAQLRADRWLYTAYAAVAVVYFVFRQVAVEAAGGSAFIAPYLTHPLHADYWPHVALQVRTYSENLLLGGVTAPFLHAGIAHRWWVPGGLVVVGLAFAATVIVLRREPRFWALAALALLTWLPASVAYVSERYVLLPSFAVAGIAGLWLRSSSRIIAAVATVVVLVWTGHQTDLLQRKNAQISQRSGEALRFSEILGPLRNRLPRGAHIVLLSFPGEVFFAQFAANVLRRELQDLTLQCSVLTVMPDDPTLAGNARAVRRGDHELELSATPALMAKPAWKFPWLQLVAGASRASASLPFAVEVLDGDGPSCRRLHVRFPAPLRDYVFVAFDPPPEPNSLPRGDLIRRGQLRVVKL